MTGRELEPIRREPPPRDSQTDVLVGLATLAARTWLRAAGWGVGTSVRAARAAVDPRAAIKMAQDTADDVRGYARQVLGVADLEERVRQLLRTPAGAQPRGDRKEATI